MSWKLELVEVGPTSRSRRMEVGWLGEIRAPAIVDDIGLDLAIAHRLLADLQRAVVALQETSCTHKLIDCTTLAWLLKAFRADFGSFRRRGHGFPKCAILDRLAH